jgi:hypothetical protein
LTRNNTRRVKLIKSPLYGVLSVELRVSGAVLCGLA